MTRAVATPPNRRWRAVIAGLLTGLVLLPSSVALGLPLAAPAAASAATGPRAGASHVLVIAHRGDSEVAPENTLPAMTAAARAGADLVEFDVQRTSDGHLVVVHDTTFARTTDVAQVFPGRVDDPVGSFTLAEVRRLDAGSWLSPAYAGTRVPTLDELLATMRPTHTGLLLELKNPELYPGYETQVARALTRTGFVSSHRVYVHSFGLPALEAFHDTAPSVPVGLLTESAISDDSPGTWLSTLNATTSAVTDSGVERATDLHLRVFAWPLDPSQATASQVERLVDDRVSGIITDDPGQTRSELAATGAGA
jgi:glycerophosphoryl diester phosphodiesterase